MEHFNEIHDSIRLLVLVLAGLAIILGFRHWGIKVLYHMIIIAFLSPFIMAFIEHLPMWLLISALIIFFGILFRRVVGEQVWGQFFGSILYDVFWRLPGRIIGALGSIIVNIFQRRW